MHEMWRSVGTVARETGRGIVRDDVLTKAAALALYSALGLAPLVLLGLAAAAWVGPGTEQGLAKQVQSLVGRQAARGVTEIIKSTKEEQRSHAAGTLSAVIGLATMLFSASGIFAQLQASLNDIWACGCGRREYSGSGCVRACCRWPCCWRPCCCWCCRWRPGRA